MGFLFPLYLAGALAVAIPIYLHLRRRPPKDSVDFSSLMFLEPTRQHPVKRRSQLENIPLLLLRCLALVLLALMFGRPFLRGGERTGAEGRMRTVLLIDTSASMRRPGAWPAARRIAEDAIGRIPDEGALAILAVDQAARTLVGFDDWESSDRAQRARVAAGAVAALEPGWLASDLGSGLITAAEMIADASADDESARPSKIVIVSDMQSGAVLDAVAEASWPSSLAVVLAPVEGDSEDNVSIVAAATGDPRTPSVRLRNDPESGVSEFQIQAGEKTLRAVVPAGESRVFPLEGPATEVVVTGDGNDFDNRLYLAPREPLPLALQFIGDGEPDDSNLPEYYFRRAFGESEILKPRFVADVSENPTILAVARSLEGGEARAVRSFAEAGGRVLVVVTSPEMGDTLESLVGIGGAALREHDGRYALLEQVDFDHPSLREFRDPRWRDFTDVHFWRFREMDPSGLPSGARVVARFDTGDPAWIHVPAGKGSFFLMLAGWHPNDSQLSLSSKFVPLLYSIFADTGPRVSVPRRFFVGDPLPLEAGDKILTLPSGEERVLRAGEVVRSSEPGIHRISGGAMARSLAVNLRPSESDLQPMAAEPFAALGVPVARDGAGSPAVAAKNEKRLLRDRESEANQNLWRWAVVILLAMLSLEAWLATRNGRVQNQPEGAFP